MPPPSFPGPSAASQDARTPKPCARTRETQGASRRRAVKKERLGKALSVANALFVLLFAASALLQLNDPDPLAWIALYVAAAAACVGWQLGRIGRRVLLAGAVVALGWAAWIAWRIELQVPLGAAMLDWGMHAGGSEEAREIGGLLIVVGWLGLLAARTDRTPRAAPAG